MIRTDALTGLRVDFDTPRCETIVQERQYSMGWWTYRDGGTQPDDKFGLMGWWDAKAARADGRMPEMED